MHLVIEMHGHQVTASSNRAGFYCVFVHLDGVQCRDFWPTYPQIPGNGSRIVQPKDIVEWQKKGGAIE